MTKRHLLEIESIMPFIIAAGVGVTFALYAAHKPQFTTKMNLPIMQTRQNLPAAIIPAPQLPQPQVTSQISPDGTRELTMTVLPNNDLEKTYTFATMDADGGNQQIIYTATHSAQTMSIPFNTWSPDNKYVFLTESTSSGTKALVMRADAQPVTETESNIDAAAVFDANTTGNVYQETTGWASDTLLIINTTLQDGSKGPSYWLEIPIKAVTQLSTEF